MLYHRAKVHSKCIVTCGKRQHDNGVWQYLHNCYRIVGLVAFCVPGGSNKER